MSHPILRFVEGTRYFCLLQHEDVGKKSSQRILDVFSSQGFELDNISSQNIFRMFHKDIISNQLIQDIQSSFIKEFGSVKLIKMNYDKSSDISYEYFIEKNTK